MHKRVMIVVLALASTCAVTGALAQQRDATARREQTPQVLARYPDVAIKFDTPALTPGRKTYTTQAELDAYIDRLPAGHVAKLTLGQSPGGRALTALLFSREGAQSPADIAALQRPIVWLIGQQHGNEPAGAEAMLALSRALAEGELTPLLDRLSVVVIPRANPDGAAADIRDNLGGADLNRDHGLMSQPETKVLHALVRQLPPAVVIDAHEFTVGRRWVDQLGGLQAVDLMLLSATHPMVPPRVRALARDAFQPAIERAIGAHGITSFVYHTMSARTGDRTISIGGNAPGIARNAFGLMGAVSFLLETRGVGIGLDSYQRRVATHYVAAKAVLETAARMGPELGSMQSDVRAAEALSAADIVLAHVSPKIREALPLIDPVTGQDKPVIVEMLDTRQVSGKEERARPAGYVIGADIATALTPRLDLMGARWCRLAQAQEWTVERYEVLARAEADPRAINPARSVTVRLVTKAALLPEGSVVVPLSQPQAARLALALEPDAPGSWTATLMDDDARELPLARLAATPQSPKGPCG